MKNHPRHGNCDLPRLRVDDYSSQIPDPGGDGDFLGDRASNRAFVEILDDWRRKVHRGGGEDPLAESVGRRIATEDIDRAALDELLHDAENDPEAAGLVQSAIEDFAQEMVAVVRRFLRQPAWEGTERIAVGGGFLGAHVGLMAIGRVGVILKAANVPVQMIPVSRHPDEAALCGAPYLAPPKLLDGADAVLAVDIGGSKIRCGLVALRQHKAKHFAAAKVVATRRWRHADDEGATREDAMHQIGEMLESLRRRARREGLKLAPFVGIGCPGVIRADGSISRGAHNLPGGDWEEEGFNLPDALAESLPKIGGGRPMVVMHNDAVVQGLSDMPRMKDVTRWGIMTVGTGLGNARFSNRKGR